MQFRKMLAELEKLNLAKDQYAIFGSGPMAIRGIRDAEDIDLIVTPGLWKKLCKKYKADKNERGTERIKIGEIEIYKEWMPVFEGLDKVISDSEMIEGYPFVKLDHVIMWKRKFGREKDKKDIGMIERFLREERFSC